MSATSILPQVPTDSRTVTESLHECVITVDHKRLGILYVLYAMVFLLVGGVEAMIMRLQLIRPPTDFVSPQVFNCIFTMHGTTMIFFVVARLVFLRSRIAARQLLRASIVFLPLEFLILKLGKH